MLIRFFKSSYSGQYLVLLILLGALWLPVFLYPTQIRQSTNIVPFWDLLVYLFNGSQLLAASISIFVVFISSLILNQILTFYDLIPKNSLEGAFVYVVFSGILASTEWIGPLLFANFFFLVLLNVILNLYEEKEAYRTVFSLGILSAVIFLFYPPFLFLIIPVYIVIVLMGNVRWRELFIPLVGLAVPLIFTFVFYFMVDKTAYFTEYFLKDFTDFKIFNPDYPITFWILIVLSGILLLAALLNIFGNISAKNIDIRKKLMTLIHFLLFSFMVFLFLQSEYHSLEILIVPLSAVVAYYLSQLKKTIKPEIIVWLILIVGLLKNYQMLAF